MGTVVNTGGGRTDAEERRSMQDIPGCSVVFVPCRHSGGGSCSRVGGDTCPVCDGVRRAE